ncbi:type II toxin-antitoxin system PemK/MazF family toxin [Corynebacterium callunae]|uniref:type II toxin-antitoxin system PemK/MazF family toxin n=1 Tax=Corynebacterium callunae TaxID=1721 RepID=UPI001FFE3087|nr:type II toxin-antitoxin system PemK/MazF family toxin [Corynebacterium callunae]MCK2199278.1 type II toxin-antitoxin system PemK/MazF family toxin [Corynebacterium callunae]
MSSSLARKASGNGKSQPGLIKRALRFLTHPPHKQVDNSLAHIRDGLGIGEINNTVESSATAASTFHEATEINVVPSESMARMLFYAPDMDGQADSGEVVWIWAPAEGPGRPPRERAMVVIGRNRSSILGLLVSCNPEHRGEESWIDIGAGGWDPRGRQSWVRLDRVLEVSELGIRRQGAVIPKGRFDRVANRLRSDFGWA